MYEIRKPQPTTVDGDARLARHPAWTATRSTWTTTPITPVDPAAAAAMRPYLETLFGNPFSAHHYATAPAAGLTTARAQVAELIGADPAGTVFTGSGSEANNLAIRGTALASAAGRRRHVITQATDHRTCAP